MTKIIDSLNWRYATKEFDTTKKVSKDDLNEIIEAFRLTSSSFGLQPWKLVIVENKEKREELLPVSWGQKQIVDASHLLVLSRVTNVWKNHIDKFLDSNCEITWATREQLKWYEDMMKGFIWNMDEIKEKKWADEQVFIALWNLLNVLAEKRIDSCAIWGFDAAKYDEILGLTEKGIASTIVLPIWYRSKNDKYSQKPKVRFSKEDILEII